MASILEKNKTAFIYRCHNHICRKFKRISKNLLELSEHISKLTGHMINTHNPIIQQKSVVFTYMKNKQLAIEKNNTTYHGIKSIKYLGINLTKDICEGHVQ